MLYFQGKGVKQDIDQGISWLKDASANGSYRAAAELGQIYLAGTGVKADELEAMKWIRRSDELANAENTEAGCD